MADVIYKYELPMPGQREGEFPLRLPVGAELLSVQLQPNHRTIVSYTPVLWARVDSEAPLETWRARWLATGEPVHFGDELVHRGTVQFQGFAPLVFHLYVEPKVVRRG